MSYSEILRIFNPPVELDDSARRLLAGLAAAAEKDKELRRFKTETPVSVVLGEGQVGDVMLDLTFGRSWIRKTDCEYGAKHITTDPKYHKILWRIRDLCEDGDVLVVVAYWNKTGPRSWDWNWRKLVKVAVIWERSRIVPRDFVWEMDA